ncbi:protein FREE1 isoform X2 [Beta vulgaris subsp. vulgaris]|uniref:protein FREE1 isoform X2 n=1 Tax=Beta vulgaris subsp. vulgaris TaxID=3555 RepID=UPI0020374944|nr:protein FREE1 isoform X2 [Beta vulgaris subsp. vulgaris]
MHQENFTPSYYHQFPQHPQPPPPPPPQSQPSYASAPPYAAADYSSSYSQNYPPFSHNPDPQPHYPPPPSVGLEAHGLYSPPPAQLQYPPTTPYYPPYDPHQTVPHNYPPPPPPQPQPQPPTTYPNPGLNSSNPAYYEKSYDNSAKFDYGSGYFDENLSGYGNYGGNRSNLGGGYDHKDDGVYAYEGKTDPYGSRGTASKSCTWSGLFDDYGRAITSPSSKKDKDKSTSLKVVRAVPKAESNTDGKSGVQKFRVKLLPETGGQSVMDVLCMVGLDGIRMLDPNSSRTLRIYPLETVTRCDKYDSSTFAFWSKTPVDIEPRRIRLQSNSYTTNTLLDTVTAATVQFKEMGGRARPSEPTRALEQSAEKKKGLGDWINKLKPVNEEKDHWVPDEAVSKCTGCGGDFSAFNRRHHCRNCGDVFCDKCTQGRTPLTLEDNAQAVRVCDRCMVKRMHPYSDQSLVDLEIQDYTSC